MELDNKEENKYQNEENKYNDFEFPDNSIPDILLNKGIEFVDIVNIMRDCASKVDEFASDIHANASQALIVLYPQLADNFNIDNIDHICIRNVIQFLKQNNDIIRFWTELDDNIIIFGQQNKQTLWLSPPTTTCSECNNQMSLKNIRHTYMASTKGIVNVVEKIFRCRQRGCTNENKATAYNYFRDCDGYKRYWANNDAGKHRQMVFSQYLNKLVFFLGGCIIFCFNFNIR